MKVSSWRRCDIFKVGIIYTTDNIKAIIIYLGYKRVAIQW